MSISTVLAQRELGLKVNGNDQVNHPEKIEGIIVGVLDSISTGGRPMVKVKGSDQQLKEVTARSVCPVCVDDLGSQVVLLFEQGDPERPIILGIIKDQSCPISKKQEGNPTEIHKHDERLILEAETEVVLRCGQASITLTKEGHLILRGAYILSRASGANRIRGASVQLN